MKKMLNHLFGTLSFLPLILLTFFGMSSFASAQTTVDVCRETLKVMQQYQHERSAAEHDVYFKANEPNMQKTLKKIADRTLLSQDDLEALAYRLQVNPQKYISRMTIEERIAFATEFQPLLTQELKEISDVTIAELLNRLDRIVYQINLREKRYKELDCENFLRREKKSEVSLAGSWKCNDGGTYIITQTGESISWKATSADQGKTFTHTFFGKIEGNIIKGHFKDEPPGSVRQEGDLEFKITSNTQLTRQKASVPFGCSVMNKKN